MEDEKPEGEDQAAIARYWINAIQSASTREKNWRERATKVIERYRDEKDRSTNQFNILWSNVETLKPALYAGIPKPDVRRRFLDADPVAKTASEVLERSLSFCVDSYDFDEVAEGCVEDYLLPGRGVARIRYKPYYTQKAARIEVQDVEGLMYRSDTMEPVDDYQEDGEGSFVDGDTEDELTYEEVTSEYVAWDDFLILCGAKRWCDVTAIAFKKRYSKEELKEHFPDIDTKSIPLDEMDPEMEGKPDQEKFKRAVVWEVWDKDERQVLAISEGYGDGPLKVIDDPLRLTEFFPCPAPLYSVKTNNTLTPIPEYTLYQDQARELDVITGRIDKLVSALKLRGVYDASQKELESLLRRDDNEMVPIENWGNFVEKGGLEKMLAFAPVQQIAAVLVQLYQQRDQTKQVIYEVTGIADIVRGATNPNETLGAQRIKGNFANLRLGKRQKEIARFIRDLYRLKAEVIAEHFSIETLQLMTGQQISPEVKQLLESDGPRAFRIDIETDETIGADQAEEQKAATDYLQGAVAFITGIAPAVQSGIVSVDTAKSLLMAATRRFKFGREVEDAIDKIGAPPEGAGAGGDTGAAPAGAPPAAPDPKAMAEAQAMQQEGQMKAQAQQQDMALKAQEAQARLQQAQQEAELKAQSDAEERAMRERVEMAKIESDRQSRLEEAQIRAAATVEAARISAGAKVTSDSMRTTE
jgi:hypothetical protein